MKFKRVEIQAFKSYLDKRDGTFDFTVQEGQPADFISIYAPNGFGKTSFYDAIDFCMTNNITRFIRDKSLANANNSDAKGMNHDGEKQHLLRAKNAPPNLESRIKIITNTGEFKSKVIRARAGSKDYAFDDKKTAPEQRYFRSVMLSQEAIDGFLREGKPETRYERFMEDQLGGDDTFEQDRQHIQSMLGVLKNRMGKLEGKVKKIRDKNLLIDLGGDPNFDASSLKAINVLVAELNNLEYEFAVIDHAFDDEAKARLLLQVAQYEESNNKKLKIFLVEKDLLERQLNHFPVYEKNYYEIAELNKKIRKITKQRDDIGQFNTLSNEKNVLMGQLNTCSTSIKEMRLREKQLPEFTELSQTKRQQVRRLKEIGEDITKHEQTLKSKQLLIDELENQKIALLKEREKHDTLKNNAPDYFSQLTVIEAEIQQRNSTVLTVEADQLERKTTQVKAKGVRIKDLKFEDLETILTSEFNNETLTDISRNYAERKELKQNLVTQLARVNSLLNAAKKQEEAVSTLIVLGSKLINQNQDQHCPLCQHKHESFAVLAEAINSNSSLNDTQQRLLKELEAYQTQINNEDDKLKQLSDDFSAWQRSKLDSLRKQLKDLLQEKQNINKWRVQLEQFSAEVNRLKGLTAHKTPEVFKAYIEDEITTVSTAIATLETKIKEAQEEAKQLKESVQQHKIDRTVLKSQSEIESDLLNGYSAFLTELAPSLDIIEPELNEQALKTFMASQLKTAMDRFENKQQEIKRNTDALNTLYASYPINFFETIDEKKEALAVQLTDLSNQLALLNGLVREFYTMVKQLEKDHLLEENNWSMLQRAVEDKISDFHHLAEQKKALNSGLQSLCNLADKVLIYIEYVKSTGELNRLDLEIKKCERIKVAFVTDLRHINDSLKTQVERYFSVDLINTIYKKIDPHPDLKRITFKCEFPDEGRPKLQVYIEDEEGNNIISPTLNFSSAQVNVLSLSIFLAKAINTTDEGKAVDCIFIDDPVQSMDAINVLGVIDLLRNLSVNLDKQIIVSTHDENFHALLQQKIPQHLFKSKFLELESFGKVAAHAGQ